MKESRPSPFGDGEKPSRPAIFTEADKPAAPKIFTDADKPAAPALFSESEKPRPPRLFDADEKGRCCRHCRYYVVHPFTQRCARWNREVEATDVCDRFEVRPPPDGG